MKATHRGNCQLCDRLQKLPSGVLSNHGYEVKWHEFLGTCPGSRELPYQLSCDAIKRSLPTTDAHIVATHDYIKKLQERSGAIGFLRVYDKSQYYWTEVEFLKNEYGRIGFKFNEKISFSHCLESNEVESTARFYDEKYIETILKPKLKYLINYREWSIKRIQDWKLSALIPLE
jgi:hypothetical protein